MGNEWSLSLGAGGLFVGTPDANKVSFAPLENFPNSGRLSPGLSGSISGENETDRFGHSVLVTEDLTGDNAPELLASAPNKQGGGGRIGAGAVYLFKNLGESLDADINAEEAHVRILGDEAGDHLGEILAQCGDMDGDGLGELLVAAPDASSLAPRGGRVFLLYSSQTPELPAQILAASIEHRITSDKAGAQLGRAMDCQNDFTGDSIPDLVIAAPFQDSTAYEAAGAVHVIAGGTSLTDQPPLLSAEWTLWGDDIESYFGTSLSTEDIDGDGLSDLWIGAPGARNGDGAAYFYAGKELSTGSRTPSLTIESHLEGARFGTAVHAAKPSPDSSPVLFVGAPRANPDNKNDSFFSGVLYAWDTESAFSSNSDNALLSDSAPYQWHNSQGYRRTGSRFKHIDTDQDGLPDLLLLLGAD